MNIYLLAGILSLIIGVGFQYIGYRIDMKRIEANTIAICKQKEEFEKMGIRF